MNELSIFVDESGDFGKFCHSCPHYIVSLVIHEQQNSIKEQILKLDNFLKTTKIGIHTIHSAPLIRRENIYIDLSIPERYKIFEKLFHFTRSVKIKYKNIIVDKKHKEQIDVNNSISKQLSLIVRDNLSYFQQFDKIIIYYDNGQRQLANILVSVFSSWFHDKFEYRVVTPSQYKLFQSADLICTLALIEQRLLNGGNLTQSETRFFNNYRCLKRNYLKHLKKLEFEE